jgi:DDE superfamily endonuclease
VVVWDNLKSCVSAAMAELADARDWLTVYQLPPYAHELNPVEPVWSHLKRSLANLAKRNLAQLTALVKTRLRRMQYRPALLEGFLASSRVGLGRGSGIAPGPFPQAARRTRRAVSGHRALHGSCRVRRGWEPRGWGSCCPDSGTG